MNTHNSQNAKNKKRRLFLTACMTASLLTGWTLGSMTTEAFSQSFNRHKNNNCEKIIVLPTTNINGETLPTILLKEIIITAKSNNNL